MKRANEISTMLGGVALVAKAERVRENTTISLVKEVIIMTIEGAKDRIVIRAKTLKMRAVAVPLETSPKFRLTFCAKAGELISKQLIKKYKQRNNFLAIFLFFRFICNSFFADDQSGAMVEE